MGEWKGVDSGPNGKSHNVLIRLVVDHVNLLFSHFFYFDIMSYVTKERVEGKYQ